MKKNYGILQKRHYQKLKLINFYFDLKSKEFSDSINTIVSLCEFVTSDCKELDALSLNEFRNYSRKTYLEIENFLNK